MDVWERKLRCGVIQEYLVKWKHMPVEDATWEGEKIKQHPNLQLLGTTISGRKDCNDPFCMTTRDDLIAYIIFVGYSRRKRELKII